MEILNGVIEDFSDLPNLSEALRLAVRLMLAAILGALLGYDREKAGKAAGLRTHILVSAGAALFIVIPQQSGMSSGDLSRVMQGLVSGIGFIAAGGILKQSSEHEIKGLTTAAGLWLTAAVGMAAGLGREASAIIGALLAFLVLAVLQGKNFRQDAKPRLELAAGTSPDDKNTGAIPGQSSNSMLHLHGSRDLQVPATKNG